MTKKFLKEIAKKLKEEEESLKQQIGKVIQPSGQPGRARPEAAFPSYGEKEDENAAEVATFEENLAIEGDLEHSLAEVQAALKKIDAGTYGRCENCGNPIPRERLLAFPTARHDLKCKATLGV